MCIRQWAALMSISQAATPLEQGQQVFGNLCGTRRTKLEEFELPTKIKHHTERLIKAFLGKKGHPHQGVVVEFGDEAFEILLPTGRQARGSTAREQVRNTFANGCRCH